MARQEGTLKLNSNVESRFNAPLDARTVVPSKSDLYGLLYAYRGLIVYVKDEAVYYKLINDLPAFPASWIVYGGDGEFNEVTEAEIDSMF